MKHCPDCNLSFPDNYRFCGSCGAGLSDAKACPTCGDIIEAQWEFCTSCGQTTSDKVRKSKAPQRRDSTPGVEAEQARITSTSEVSESALPPPGAHAWYEAPELLNGIEEITAPSIRVSHVITPESASYQRARAVSFGKGNGERKNKQPPTLSMLSAYGQEVEQALRPAQPTYPIFIGAGLIVLLMTIGFGVWYVFAHRAAAATHSERGSAQTQVGNDLSSATGGANPSEPSPQADTRDYDWNRLSEKRRNATPAEQPEVIAALEEAEGKYPSDYRFPYERAKLSIKGITSHHDAFAALASAAEKAIDSGQAQEMLDSLLADKDGDFWKPSHGHHEWHALIEALEHKDKTGLIGLRH
jgi:double zinc ribbon protein